MLRKRAREVGLGAHWPPVSDRAPSFSSSTSAQSPPLSQYPLELGVYDLGFRVYHRYILGGIFNI